MEPTDKGLERAKGLSREYLSNYQELLDHSNTMIYVSDCRTHEMLYANRAAREYVKGNGPDFAGRKCYEYIRGNDAPCEWCFMGRVQPGALYEMDRFFKDRGLYQHIAGGFMSWFGREAMVQYVDDVTENRELQNKLRDSREMYKVAVGGADLGVWSYDIPGRVLTRQESSAVLPGLPDVVEGVPESLFWNSPESEWPVVRRLFEDIHSGKAVSTAEFWTQPGPGAPVRFNRAVFTVVRDAQGNPEKAFGILRDITEEKRESDKYRHSLQDLLAANPRALCTFRLNLTDNRCGDGHGTSTKVQNLISARTVDGLFTNIAAIIPDLGESQAFLRVFNRMALLDAFAHGQTRLSMNYRRVMDNGDSHWVNTSVNMLQDPMSRIVEAVAYSVDADYERKEEEIIAAITQREHDSIALINVKTHHIGYYCSNREVQSIDGGEERDYDATIRQVLGTMADDADWKDVLPRVTLSQVTRELAAHEDYVFTYSSRDGAGHERRKQLTFRYLDEHHEEILMTRTDITDAFLQEREQTARIRRALQEAEHANAMKSDFLSNVSHDMRTPLNAILGYTRLATQTDDPAQAAAYLKKIGRAGNILLTLINDTLDLSKIETGEVILKPAPVRCNEVIRRILTSIKPVADEKGVRLTVDNSRALMATINVDALRLQEILINLMSNAVKFTPPGGEVTLSVECVALEKNRLRDRLTVRDTGVGMSADFLPNIFEPFSQERTDATADVGGSGLGLSIVKKLVDLMGGTIAVKSELGVGSEFVIELDFERVDDSLAREKERERQTQSLRGRHVLLCEDNAMNREIATRLLQMEGMTVTAAENGQKGLDRFNEEPAGTFDAILMDIRMPVMDGRDATRAIRGMDRPDARTIPIVAMSADAYDDDVLKSLESGMNAHIAKPVDPEKLFDTLVRFCGVGE